VKHRWYGSRAGFGGRDFHAGMAQKLLHDFRILPVRIEERPEGVPERVIRDMLVHSGPLHRGPAVVTPKRTWPVRLPAFLVR